MAYAQQRPKFLSLIKGTTEGKYYYVRPDTEDVEMANTSKTLQDRSTLNMWDGFSKEETPQKMSPGM